MDAQLQNSLRCFMRTDDPHDAVKFVHQYLRTLRNPQVYSDEFYTAWWWLVMHPAFNHAGERPGFTDSLVIDLAKVNPETSKIEDDKTLNTKVEVWLEAGPWIDPSEAGYPEDWAETEVASHDINLDCGGDTFEEAIIKMAELVKKHYGEYQTK